MNSPRQRPVLSVAAVLLLAASCTGSRRRPRTRRWGWRHGRHRGCVGIDRERRHHRERGGAAGGGSGGSGGSGAPSSGCGVTGAPTGAMTTLTITVAGRERAYVLFVPTNYDASARYPLIFAWHGLGGTGTLARSYFRIEQAAANQAILVYPTALPNAQGMAAWDLAAAGVDVQLFERSSPACRAGYCIDGNRVFSAGHSYGGYMTNRLGCTRGDVLRAIAPWRGPPFGGGRGRLRGPGRRLDRARHERRTVDFAQGEAARDRFLTANGCGATTMAAPPDACVAYDGCMPDLPVHWCVHMMDPTGRATPAPASGPSSTRSSEPARGRVPPPVRATRPENR